MTGSRTSRKFVLRKLCHSGTLAALLFLGTGALLFAQSDRGTITGTVSDQVGSLIPNAKVVATNAAAGTQLRTQTTDTGNFTIASVPAATYTITVEAAGFRQAVESGVVVQVAQTVTLNLKLEVGALSDSISVQSDTQLLNTTTAEQSTVITGDTINVLPLNFAGDSAIRNPLTFAELAPGSSVGGWNDIHINGSPGSSFRIIFEGQDTTSALQQRVSDESQPSVDAIQEFALQTSNFSAEFGTVTGGLFNFTARSGTNQFHGTAYEYFANDALNAGNPFTDDGTGHHVLPRVRQNDFGGTIGGPVWIPKVYNGHNKTFFFFNYEMYRNIQTSNTGLITVPTTAYRNGDFSYLLTGQTLGTDPLGRPIMGGAIYDPATSRTVAGQVVRDPFPGNIIPVNRFDPVAVKIQNLIPLPNAAYANSPANNFAQIFPNQKIQWIPSIKVDHNFTQNARVAVYFSEQGTDKDNGGDGLTDPVSARRFQVIRSYTTRISYDHVISPALINHFGVGYQRYRNPDSTPITSYDSVAQLGLKGAIGPGFPRIEGLNINNQTYRNNAPFAIGPTNFQLYLQDKPTAVESLTWVRGNHTLKFGGEWKIDTFTNSNFNGQQGYYGFDSSQTGLPSTQGQNLQGGSIGNGYASFLLGLANTASISNPADPQYRRLNWSAFAQDSWKISRRLTLDIGLRYDLQNPAHELHYRTTAFDPNIPNPSAGGLLGAAKFYGSGPGRCNCDYISPYKLAFGPRLGAAYQINDKTVFRAGWGLTFGQISAFNYIGSGNSLGFGFNSIAFSSGNVGEPGAILSKGLNYSLGDLLAVNLNPGIRPTPGQLDSLPNLLDNNGGRPPRVNNWNFSLQRVLAKNVSVEAAYVGNRGVWLTAPGLIDLNALTPQRLASFGLDINNTVDQALLTSRIDSPQAAARGFRAPYAGFPSGSTVAQSLRPYPQFSSVGTQWSPLGNSWYDALQLKLTQRFSRGLETTVAYTYSKTQTTATGDFDQTVPVNDVFNRRNQKTLAPYDQPHILAISFHYEIPTFGLATSGWKRSVFGGWETGGILRYSSGFPIQVPDAQNKLSDLLFRGTRANRVPGQPLFLKDLNCGCIDPSRDLVLNPKAWADPAPGQFGTAAAYYSDYRYQRRPTEQVSLGKTVRFTEKTSLEFRGEFFNIFNRRGTGNPGNIGNALQPTQYDSQGNLTNAFGRITPTDASGAYPPRSGQIVARFRF